MLPPRKKVSPPKEVGASLEIFSEETPHETAVESLRRRIVVLEEIINRFSTKSEGLLIFKD